MATRRRMGKSRALLEIGDVIKTHPVDGYWGCAVVLTQREATEQFDPMCHIGITSTVLRNDFAFEDLDTSRFTILTMERRVRIDAETSATRRETCIGIYSRKRSPLPVLGQIDPTSVFSEPLEFIAGNGADGGWPFCGGVTKSLGNEAVHEWRAKHDAEACEREIAEASASFEDILRREKHGRKP